MSAATTEVTAGSDAPGPRRGPGVLRLGDPACDPGLAGGKGAALAWALSAGLPVLPGFVITTAATATFDQEGWTGALDHEVQSAWRGLSEDGSLPLVVRSSSTGEDLDQTSMAGRFRSVIGVRGWDEFRDAVAAVLDSRRDAAGEGAVVPHHAMAVLVQPLLEPVAGGVMFGVDPVTGRSDRIVVAAVEGGPDKLVSGEVEGTRYELKVNSDVVSEAFDVVGPGLFRFVLQPALDDDDERQASSLAGVTAVTVALWIASHGGTEVLRPGDGVVTAAWLTPIETRARRGGGAGDEHGR